MGGLWHCFCFLDPQIGTIHWTRRTLGLDDCAEALRDCHRLGDTEVAVEAKRLENEAPCHGKGTV